MLYLLEMTITALGVLTVKVFQLHEVSVSTPKAVIRYSHPNKYNIIATCLLRIQPAICISFASSYLLS